MARGPSGDITQKENGDVVSKKHAIVTGGEGSCVNSLNYSGLSPRTVLSVGGRVLDVNS